jgi:hypothetical protein
VCGGSGTRAAGAAGDDLETIVAAVTDAVMAALGK